MTEPVKIEFTLVETLHPDIQMMNIWAEALNHFHPQLDEQQILAASEWFYNYVKANYHD